MNAKCISSIELRSVHNKIQKLCNYSINQEIRYDRKYRKENLGYLRKIFNASQNEFARLIGVQGQTKYSAMERGEESLTLAHARRIEHELDLPENWFDRDNKIFLTEDEYSLIYLYRKLSDPLAKNIF